MLVERHVDGIRAAAEDERVAIGRPLRDMGGTEHSASAGDVFNDDLLPHDLGHALGHDTPHHIGTAPGGPGNDQGQRSRRPVLGRRRRHGVCSCNERESKEKHGFARHGSLTNEQQRRCTRQVAARSSAFARAMRCCDFFML